MKNFLFFCAGFGFCFLLITYLFFSNGSLFQISQIQFESAAGEFKFQCIPQKGRDAEMMEKQFVVFKTKHPSFKEDVLYRVTRKNYLNVAKWAEYKLMPEWQYPLKN